MTADPHALITAAKLEHWDKQAAFSARLKELGARKQDMQEKLQAVQQKHQQRFEVEAKPLNLSLEALDKELQRELAEFQAYDAENAAYVKALTGMGNDGRDHAD